MRIFSKKLKLRLREIPNLWNWCLNYSLKINIIRGGKNELFEASSFFPSSLCFTARRSPAWKLRPKDHSFKIRAQITFYVCLFNHGGTERARPPNTALLGAEPLPGESPLLHNAELGAQRARPPSSARAERAARPRKAEAAPGQCDPREQRGGIQSIHSITFTFSRDFFLNFPLEVVTWAKHPAI